MAFLLLIVVMMVVFVAMFVPVMMLVMVMFMAFALVLVLMMMFVCMHGLRCFLLQRYKEADATGLQTCVRCYFLHSRKPPMARNDWASR